MQMRIQLNVLLGQFSGEKRNDGERQTKRGEMKGILISKFGSLVENRSRSLHKLSKRLGSGN
jgi:hypothetical protein